MLHPVNAGVRREEFAGEKFRYRPYSSLERQILPGRFWGPREYLKVPGGIYKFLPLGPALSGCEGGRLAQGCPLRFALGATPDFSPLTPTSQKTVEFLEDQLEEEQRQREQLEEQVAELRGVGGKVSRHTEVNI